LFDVVILLENIHNKKYIHHTNPNIIFSFLRVDDHVQGTVHYNASLYHKKSIERIVRHFIRLMEEAIFCLYKHLSQIDMIGGDEKRQLLYEFNDTRREYPAAKTIDEIFREQARRTSHKLAVTGREDSLTYDVLNGLSDRMAVYLHTIGLKREEVVGIMAENSTRMIVGLLAILKVGGAYLPVNWDYPQERREYLAKDGSIKKFIGPASANIPGVEILDWCDPGIYKERNSPEWNHSYKNLAYIMYTSGSTGTPKGVMVEHRCVVRLVKNTNYVEFTNQERIMQTGALDFDASTFEIWGALLNGAHLHLTDKEIILNPVALKQVVLKKEISMMWMTSPLFNHMLDENIEIFQRIKTLVVGGDVLSPSHINQIRARFPGIRVINGYGPTENTTFSTTYSPDREINKRIPIGKPIANSRAYILDCNYHLVPIGVSGELFLGGDGLARGYLNNPGLTAKKFDHDLWDLQDYHDGKKSNEKFLRGGSGGAVFSKGAPPGRRRQNFYRTGDLARWLEDGNIEFLGRIDHQIKIRGYRVEPGEIEKQLLTLGYIDEAVVIAREKNSEKFLFAYVISREGKPIDVAESKHLLSRKLPPYMIPSYFVQLEKIPLTPNGKIDRKALDIMGKQLELVTPYTAPRNEVEKKIADIWKEVLHVERVGIHDNYFDLGGTSFGVIRINSKLKKAFNVEIPIVTMFRYTTVHSLANYLDNGEKEIPDRVFELERGKRDKDQMLQKRRGARNR
jgi:tyrocidine synthetase-3